ncbi:MAG TPA: TIGR03435 family protein, partial [Tepidisphaeraceae bacterium]|nr:TIGR03435 family protein [Tepidisphaeraceae bacterium]
MMLRNLVVLCAAVAAVHGQSFEAASIKVSVPKSERGSQGGPGSARYSFHRGKLLDFLAIGFDVEYRQVAGKADLDKVEFDLDATLPPGTTREQLHAMIRNLLAERFHLKQHIETREFAGYELVVSKTGHKLLPEGTSSE